MRRSTHGAVRHSCAGARRHGSRTGGKAEYPNVLADLNAHQLAFSVFDGDLKAGGDGACTNDLYTTSLAFFNSLRAPLIFTPGDNDWTDCWGRYGPGTGGFDPEERLAF